MIPANRFILALVLAVILASVATFAALSWFRNRDAERAERVASCMSQHDMKAQTVSSPEDGPTKYQKCTWPPAPNDQDDGYSEINVGLIDIQGGTEAGGDAIGDDVIATCSMVRFKYVTMDGDRRIDGRPFEATLGTEIRVAAGRPYEEHTAPMDAEPNEILLFHGFKQRLFSAECVN